MDEINVSRQLDIVSQLTDLIERAAQLCGDESCLDVLEGTEGESLANFEQDLSSARSALRALRRQLRARKAAEAE